MCQDVVVKALSTMVRAKRGLLYSGSVRVGGAALVAIGLVLGVRILGVEQFGVSVLVLAVGQVLAFPLTALERLLIRVVATGDTQRATRLLTISNWYCALLGVLTAIAVIITFQIRSPQDTLFVAAAGLTAVTSSLLTIRQGLNRALGNLMWGQLPNELFRPAMSIIGYVVAILAATESFHGSTATAVASLATLILILWAPTRIPNAKPNAAQASGTGMGYAMMSLLIISAVAVAVERLYPILIGSLATKEDVTLFAVVLRVIQLANFGQAFGVFFYSPHMARSLNPADVNFPEARRLAGRIRLVGLLTATPVAALCAFTPDLVGSLIDPNLLLTWPLRIAALVILAQALAGPTQTVLIMAGQEVPVAMIYLTGYLVSISGYLTSSSKGAVSTTAWAAVAFVIWAAIMAIHLRRTYGRWL